MSLPVVLHHPEAGILELQWLEGSAGMTDGDFMASMQRYSAHAEQHQTPYLLVDVTRFKHSPGPDVATWRDQHIIPGYNPGRGEEVRLPGPGGRLMDG